MYCDRPGDFVSGIIQPYVMMGENKSQPSVCAGQAIGRDGLPVRFLRRACALILLPRRNMYYSRRWRPSHREVRYDLALNCPEWVGRP